MRRAVVLLLAMIVAGVAHAAELTASQPRQITFSVRDRAGFVHGSAEFHAPLNMVHFWASWCAPCRRELPALQALQAELRDKGVAVIAVSVDRLGWDAIDRTIKPLGVDRLAMFHDLNREATQALRVEGLPTTIVMDGAGREIARLVGEGDWGDPELRRKILSLAKQ